MPTKFKPLGVGNGSQHSLLSKHSVLFVGLDAEPAELFSNASLRMNNGLGCLDRLYIELDEDGQLDSDLLHLLASAITLISDATDLYEAAAKRAGEVGNLGMISDESDVIQIQRSRGAS